MNFLNDVEYYTDSQTGIRKEQMIPECEFCTLNIRICKVSEYCQVQEKIDSTIKKFSYADAYNMKMDLIKRFFYEQKARRY